MVAGERGRLRLDDLIGDEDAVAIIPVEDYDLDVARSHAPLLAHAHRSGRRGGAHDLIIAATALLGAGS